MTMGSKTQGWFLLQLCRLSLEQQANVLSHAHGSYKVEDIAKALRAIYPHGLPPPDPSARIFAADLKTKLEPRHLRHGEKVTNIINHHDHLVLSGVNASNGKVEIPRYHARIGKTYLK